MTVHVLSGGFPLCRFTTHVPRYWPRTELWVSIDDHPEDATCESCRWRAAGGEVLEMWIILAHPVDHPEHFVLRRDDVIPGKVLQGPKTLHNTLEEARAAVPPGLHNMGRQPGDERVIVEAWV